MPIEERGAEAAADMVAAAQVLLDSHLRRQAAEQELGQLLVKAGYTVRPSDVATSNAGPTIRECQRLVLEGEQAPVLRRYPGEALGGEPAEVEEAMA